MLTPIRKLQAIKLSIVCGTAEVMQRASRSDRDEVKAMAYRVKLDNDTIVDELTSIINEMKGD